MEYIKELIASVKKMSEELVCAERKCKIARVYVDNTTKIVEVKKEASKAAVKELNEALCQRNKALDELAQEQYAVSTARAFYDVAYKNLQQKAVNLLINLSEQELDKLLNK